MIAIGVAIGVVFIVLGFVVLTDRVDTRPWRRPSKTPAVDRRNYRVGCRDCGMEDLPLDYYRRCHPCADLEELRGGVKSVPAGYGYRDGRFVAPDTCDLKMERIRG